MLLDECEKDYKIQNHKVTYIFSKTLVFFIISDNCGSKDEKILKKKINWDIENFLFYYWYEGVTYIVVVVNKYIKNMVDKSISQYLN